MKVCHVHLRSLLLSMTLSTYRCQFIFVYNELAPEVVVHLIMKAHSMNYKNVREVPEMILRCLETSAAKEEKKPSNTFINFSNQHRPCFVHVLKEASMESGRVKNPSQRIVQKMAAQVWRRLRLGDTQKNKWQSHSVETIIKLAKDCLLLWNIHINKWGRMAIPEKLLHYYCGKDIKVCHAYL